MAARRSAAIRAGLLLALAAIACRDALNVAAVPPPDSLVVAAVGMHAARIEWMPVDAADAVGYRLERRRNLTGGFADVSGVLPQALPGPLYYFDTGLDPDTYYGYRLVTLTRFGERSRPSVVRAAKTPPPPGVLVTTTSQLGTPQAVDLDGYVVAVMGPATPWTGPIGPNGQTVVTPLPPGPYTVELRDVAPHCAFNGGPAARGVTVTDQGTHTVDTVRYALTCRDPHLGRIVAAVAAQGDSLDPDGYELTLTGLADGVPDSLQLVSRRERINSPPGGNLTFDNLLPGEYEVAIDDVAAQCTVNGATTRSIEVTPLSSAIAAFPVSCQGGGPVTGFRPFVWRNVWSPATAQSGQRVALDLTLDLSAIAGQTVSGAQSEMRYDAALLRFDSATAAALPRGFTVNGTSPGVVAWLGLTSGAPQSGVVALGRFHFTVTGVAGSAAATRTAYGADAFVVSADDQGEMRIDTLTRVVEDTLPIAAGSGNQPPSVNVNGPYAGSAGSPVAFSAAGSADPDGTIVTYAWTFGDGGTGIGAGVTHAYAAAGSYAVSLTLTDDDGATASAQTTATVTATGANQPPVARANGPYSGTAGTPVILSAAGSTDPDGTIQSYAWAFGDGASGADASAAHAYAAAGVYTAVLTVTDDDGATATSTAAVSIVAGGGPTTPFTWAGAFGAMNPADSVIPLVVTLDLSTDIPETTGPEALATFVVDSLKWDPTVLRYFAFNWGPGGSGSVNTTHAESLGKLGFGSFTLPGANSGGVVAVATIRFKVIGTAGRATTTATALGPLTGTAATGAYAYRARTRIIEATVTLP